MKRLLPISIKGEGVAFCLISYATLLHSARLLKSDSAQVSVSFDEEAFRPSSEGAPRFSQLHIATSSLAPSTFPPPYPY